MKENEVLLIRKDLMTLNHKVKKIEGLLEDLQNNLEDLTSSASYLSKKLDILSTPDYIGKANEEYEKTKGE